MPDINSTQTGPFLLVTGETDDGRDWLADNLDDGMTLGESYVVEPRYIDAILCGAFADGLTIGIDGRPVEPQS